MEQFKSIQINIPESSFVQCDFQEHNEESIMRVDISGTCRHGSQGENYGQFLYQKIGLSLLIIQPLAVLIDLRELQYAYGDRIVGLFQVFDDVRVFGNDDLLTAYVLSDKNKYGLASLCQFDPDNPKPPMFYDENDAWDYLIREYDKI